MKREQVEMETTNDKLEGRDGRRDVLLQDLPVLAHPRPPPVRVDACIRAQWHAAPRELDHYPGYVPGVLCKLEQGPSGGGAIVSEMRYMPRPHAAKDQK